ncbi:FxLD family lantipeptide [Streptomyces bathyalis]|uniref:FxLD family lantipeptide n=1 Tax=Streptomyces bathyalis TaxID=2710756 RepID=A0A7T1WV43_9ACTN|nr:FxLD family lantipeptide [Streptomyces bathyalis]
MSTTSDETQVNPPKVQAGVPDGFQLDVALVEVADTAGLVSITNDGCGSTCGACTTNVA